MLKLFIGHDDRQYIATSTLIHSLNKHSSVPLAITTLNIKTLPIKRTGLTTFTFSRFLCPYLCDFKGISIFLDADMLCLTDINQLINSVDLTNAVSVVHFQDDLRYERPSLMVFNNELCTNLTPEFIDNEQNILFDFKWAGEVGEVDPSWNFLVYYQNAADFKKVNLVHYTAGIPIYKETRDCDYSGNWRAFNNEMNDNVSWLEIMGNSKHASIILNKLQEKMK